MKPIQTILITLAIFAFAACTGNTKKDAANTTATPTIDITKKYPTKEIAFQDFAEVNYIPLGTSDKVLLDEDAEIAFTSPNKIITFNRNKGDVFIFDGKGKIISHFNNKGQSGQEYHNIHALIYDEENKEIIIQDYQLKNQFRVYDENGKYKRSLPFPEDCSFKNVMNYNKETLIAYENNYVHDAEKNHLARKKPYVFLSKKDGSVVSEVDIILDERISTTFMQITGTSAAMIIMNEVNILKYGKGFVLNDVACDTVFYYDEQRTLAPLLIRQPSVLSMDDPKLVMFFERVTKDYFFVASFLNEYNFTTGKRGERIDLAYNRNSGEIYSYNLYNEDMPTFKHARHYKLLPADLLIEMLEENKLKGKLKEIAEQLDPDDNPVVVTMEMK